jgi:cyclomaltodextrinase
MAINPDYGTARDLKHLVDAVHDHDMRIIIDMVLNHGARDHVKFKLNPEMFNTEFIHSPQEWSDAREFNYNYPETTKYAFDVLKHWIQEFNIDGYRCDVAGMIPRMFWENSVEKLLDIKADLYMLAEWQDRALLNRAFHSTYDWTLYLLMKDVQRSKRSASDLLTWQEQIRHGYPENACPLKFTENHDMPRTITTFKSKQFYPFSAFSFFVPGVPLIYNGQEQGFKMEPSLFEKTAMDWQAMDEKIHEFYKKLIRIRYTNKSVFNGNLENISNDQPENVVSFARNDENSKIIIILNFKNGAVSVNIQTEDDFRNIFFSDLITGSRIRPVDGNIELKANQVMVLEG